MTELFQRVAKHAKLNWQNLALPDVPSPPFLILFINSLCNMERKPLSARSSNCIRKVSAEMLVGPAAGPIE